MSALDQVLSAPDPFAAFGFERTFDVNLAQLDQRYAGLVEQATALQQTDRDNGGRILAALNEGRRVLADPVARGRLLLDLLGGAGDPATGGLPPRVREKLEAGGGGAPGWQEGERRRLVSSASYLFRQLGSADNGVVQRERRRQIRESLNAIEQLDRTTAARP
jgi:hypothetical protein